MKTALFFVIYILSTKQIEKKHAKPYALFKMKKTYCSEIFAK